MTKRQVISTPRGQAATAWRIEEDGIVREHWIRGDPLATWIAKLPGRTARSISQRAQHELHLGTLAYNRRRAENGKAPERIDMLITKGMQP